MLEKVFEFANQQVEVTGGKHAMAVTFGAPRLLTNRLSW
jgi:hypothetical protein